jgi:hypothetical protein
VRQRLAHPDAGKHLDPRRFPGALMLGSIVLTVLGTDGVENTTVVVESQFSEATTVIILRLAADELEANPGVLHREET